MVIRLGITRWRVEIKERVAVVIMMKKKWNKIRDDGETKCRNRGGEAEGAISNMGVCYSCV